MAATRVNVIKNAQRCDWAMAEPELTYHDREWGVPVHDDRRLFEMLILEGAQAGLSWRTILKRREGYRAVFHDFDATVIARFTEADEARLMLDERIIRNRLKIKAAVLNARAFLAVQQELGSFDRYLWSFVDGKPIVNQRQTMKDIPPRSPESDVMSKVLAKRGFKFVGSTICYAFMQAVGMVNDHLVTCPRHAAVQRRRR